MRHIGQRKRATCEKQAELRGQYLSMERDWLEKVVTFEAHQRKKQIALEQKLASRSTSTRGFQGNTANDPIGYARLIPPNPEEEYRYTRTLAVVPPMLMDEHEREDVRYVDENRQFDESVQSLRNFNQLNPWTAEEKQVFLQKWVEYPKEFGQIATHLPNKTAQGSLCGVS